MSLIIWLVVIVAALAALGAARDYLARRTAPGARLTALDAPGDGAYAVEVVGESHYAASLRRIAAGRRPPADASAVLAAEGTIIMDSKGNPIAHPALAIERAAAEQLRRWGRDFEPRRRR